MNDDYDLGISGGMSVLCVFFFMQKCIEMKNFSRTDARITEDDDAPLKQKSNSIFIYLRLGERDRDRSRVVLR